MSRQEKHMPYRMKCRCRRRGTAPGRYGWLIPGIDSGLCKAGTQETEEGTLQLDKNPVSKSVHGSEQLC